MGTGRPRGFADVRRLLVARDGRFNETMWRYAGDDPSDPHSH
uniref:Uncharacterized protein n=1 Tax=Arundo donax TaxID=35708 RepID=A0A0A8YAH5_ARUDO